MFLQGGDSNSDITWFGEAFGEGEGRVMLDNDVGCSGLSELAEDFQLGLKKNSTHFKTCAPGLWPGHEE